MKVDAELFDLCKEFIKENKIECSETIYQTDRVVENSLEFIESICDLIGYHEEDDEDEDEEDYND
jgi:hypothetical protein